MPQHVGNLLERRSALIHQTRSGVAQDMRPRNARVESSPAIGLAHGLMYKDRADWFSEGRTMPDEDIAMLTARSSAT